MGALKTTGKKLAPLIRLLASDQPGEVVAAAAGIARVLRAAGCDLNDLADEIIAVAEAPGPRKAAFRGQHRTRAANDDPEAARWFDAVTKLWTRGQSVLPERDLDFLRNVWAKAQQGVSPSYAQQKWIRDIETKLSRKGAHAS
ncbi:MAG: hypothetical protein ABL866_17650 [Devosia sp.]